MRKVPVILIGGFLGAGKTTLVAQAAQRLVQRGQRVGLITNDQAANLVDTAILEAAGSPVCEVSGGCFCCRFEDLLSAMEKLMRGNEPRRPDRRAGRQLHRSVGHGAPADQGRLPGPVPRSPFLRDGGREADADAGADAGLAQARRDLSFPRERHVHLPEAARRGRLDRLEQGRPPVGGRGPGGGGHAQAGVHARSGLHDVRARRAGSGRLAGFRPCRPPFRRHDRRGRLRRVCRGRGCPGVAQRRHPARRRSRRPLEALLRRLDRRFAGRLSSAFGGSSPPEAALGCGPGRPYGQPDQQRRPSRASRRDRRPRAGGEAARERPRTHRPAAVASDRGTAPASDRGRRGSPHRHRPPEFCPRRPQPKYRYDAVV